MDFNLSEDKGEEHFAILYDKLSKGFFVLDLPRSHGTFVKTVRTLPLKSSDLITFASSRMLAP
jgi:hypothetical protein